MQPPTWESNCQFLVLAGPLIMMYVIFQLYNIIAWVTQPENPAQLGGKIYEMMGVALSGKWSTPVEAYNNPGASSNNTETIEAEVAETIEAEVVEPVEAGSKK